MTILRRAGFDDRTTSLASGALINYAAGFALFESKSPGGAGSPEAQGPGRGGHGATSERCRPSATRRCSRSRPSRSARTSSSTIGLQRLLDGLEQDLASRRPTDETSSTDGGDTNTMLIR